MKVQRVSEKTQRPLRGNPGVKLPDRTGRRVARVDKSFFVLQTIGDALALARVQAFEIIASHVDFAANLQVCGCQVRKSQRYLSYGAYVVGHILASFTIAAGAGLHQQVVAVHQTDGQSIKFQFSHIVHRRICFTELQLLAYPCVKLHRALLADIGFCVNAEHRHAVAHLCE